MKLYTSYYGKMKTLDKEGIVPIAISLTIPDWAPIDRDKCWFKELAPFPSMIKMPMEEYIPRYEIILSKAGWLNQRLGTHVKEYGTIAPQAEQQSLFVGAGE